MSYTLIHGFKSDTDNIQLSLLITLPLVALLLSIGALTHRSSSNTPAQSPKVIPIVSTITPASASSSVLSGGTNNSKTSKPTSQSGQSSQTSSAVPNSSGNRTISTSTPTQQSLIPLNTTLYVPPVNVQTGQKPIASSSGSSLFLN